MSLQKRLIAAVPVLPRYGFLSTLMVVLSTLLVGYFVVWHEQALVLRLDSYGYLETAQDLADWSLSWLHRRSAGYPLLLRILGVYRETSNTTGLFILQLLLHGFMVAFAAVSMFRLSVNHKVAILVLLVLMMEPLIVGSTALLMSETLTMFLLVIGTCSLLLYLDGGSGAWSVLSALSLSYVALVRPTFQLLAVVVVVVLGLAFWLLPALRRRIAQVAGLNLLLSFLFVGGVILYNNAHFGFAGLTPLAGYNLATRTPYALELIPDDQAEVREILIRHRHETITTEPLMNTANGVVRYIWGATDELKQELGMDDLELARYLVTLNLDLIRRAPNLYLEMVALAAANYWQPFSPGKELIAGVPLVLLSVAHVVKLLFLLAMLAVVIAAPTLLIFMSQESRRKVAQRLHRNDHVKLIGVGLWLAIAAYNMAISTGMDVGSPRHRLATDPLLILSAIVALDYLLRLRVDADRIMWHLPEMSRG